MGADEDEILVTEDDVRRLFQNKGLQSQMAEGVISPTELARIIGVRPQMVYNYLRSGKLPQMATQKKLIALDVAVTWVQKYLNKKALKRAQIERELHEF